MRYGSASIGKLCNLLNLSSIGFDRLSSVLAADAQRSGQAMWL
jgi:hypothetical protein